MNNIEDKHLEWVNSLTKQQQEVYESLKVGIIPKNSGGIFEKSQLACPIFAYLPCKSVDKELIGKKIKANKVRKLSLKPSPDAILFYLPANTEGIATSNYVYLSKSVNLYPLKITEYGRYVGSTKRRLSIGAVQYAIPKDVGQITIPKVVSGTITEEDLEHLAKSPHEEHRNLAERIRGYSRNPELSTPQEKDKQVKIKETSENIEDLADAHKEFDLVSQSLKDLGTFLQGSPYKERAYDASVELPSRKEIAGKLKDIVLEHSGNTFSPEGYNSEGVHVDDYVKNWFNELYHEHRDKIHGSPFSDTFYSIDVVPNKQKQEHIFDIDTGRYEKRDTPHSHTMVWSKEYGSPEGTQKLRHFVAGSEVDAISGKRVPLHNQKFYKKDLEQLPEGESAGGEIPVALSNYIRNVILADRTVGKKITKILINKDLSSRHQAFIRDSNGHWHTIRALPTDPQQISGDERRNIEEVKRLKDLATPIEHGGQVKSKYSHLLDHTYNMFLEHVDKIDTVSQHIRGLRGTKSPQKNILREEYERLLKERNALGSKIVRMITGIRPGYNYHSTEGGIDLVGSRTLRPKHVRVGDNRVTVDFFGKTSKRHLQDYEHPILKDMFEHTMRQNKDYARNVFSSRHKRKNIKSYKDLYHSLPLFFGVTNSAAEKKFMSSKLDDFMENTLKLHPNTIRGMKDYDDRKMMFNMMAAKTAKDLTEQYKDHEDLHPLDVADIIHKTLALTSTRTGNRYDTLKNSYILPGLLRHVIDRHFNTLKGQ